MFFNIDKYKRKQINSLIFSLLLGVLSCFFIDLRISWIIIVSTQIFCCFFFLRFIFSCYEIKDIKSWNNFFGKK